MPQKPLQNKINGYKIRKITVNRVNKSKTTVSKTCKLTNAGKTTRSITEPQRCSWNNLIKVKSCKQVLTPVINCKNNLNAKYYSVTLQEGRYSFDLFRHCATLQ